MYVRGRRLAHRAFRFRLLTSQFSLLTSSVITHHSSLITCLASRFYGPMMLLDLIYIPVLAAASPYLLSKRKIRAGLKEKLGFVQPRAGSGPCAWFHCVSVGEVGLARELVRRFEARFPELPVAVSTTTDTGRSAAEKFFPNHAIFYYPFDISLSVKKTLRAIRPKMIVLMEQEVWPNLLITARKQGVPVVIVNGRITEKVCRRLARIRFVVEPLLRSIHTIAVQDADYAGRFIRLGAPPERVIVTGNMKYDTVKTSVDPAHPAYAAVKGLGAEPMLVGGCTWDGEEQALLRVFAGLKRTCPGLGLVLAPKHAERLPAVRRLIEGAGFACAELSSLKLNRQNGENNRTAPLLAAEPGQVVLVDTFGELDAVYAAADAVFVGRSLTQHGGQNMLEPAALGKAVFFGPHTENFREAAELLLAAGAAFKIDSENGLHQQIANFIKDREAFVRAGAAARKVVETKKGATEKNLGILEETMNHER